MGNRLQIRALGGLAIRLDNEPVRDLASRKAEALLLYLACNPRPYPREVLAELLWDNRSQRQAMANLRVVLSSLRKELGAFVSITRTTAGVETGSDLWVDAAQLEEAVAGAEVEEGVGSAAAAERLAETLALYEGDFLAGYFLPGASGFETWAVTERERLHRLAVDGSRHLGHWYLAQKDYSAAIASSSRLVGIDPLAEVGQRQLMEALACSGQRTEALRQYETYAQLLDEELGMEPSASLQGLYKAIGVGEGVIGAARPEGLLQNRYRLETRLRAGAMGDLYRATDTHTGEAVAVKTLNPELVRDDPSLLARFQQEGETLRALNHPNIVTLLDIVSEGNVHYLVMEHVPGGDLAGLLADHPEGLPVERIMALALDVADALTHAHRLDILHRDLRPANVLIAEDGTPRLSGFGLAPAVEHGRLRGDRGIMGALDYIAPEVLNGEAVDARADVWSLGVMIFEMLAGRRPFQGDTLAALLASIVNEPVPDLVEIRSDGPVELVDLVYRMLEKDSLARIPSVRHVGAQLEDIAHGRTRDRPASRFAAPLPDMWQRPAHNLPSQSTPFVGRERELTELARMMAETETGFVSIVAPGGMGKTRLALALAERYVSAGGSSTGFEDGVYLVELAPLEEPAAIVPAIAAAIGYHFSGDGRSPRQQLVDFLSDKQMLLVLDNFEHLLDGAPLVTDIGQAAPHLTMITTSRQRLGQPGERLFYLAGMDSPEWERPEEALAYAAVKLFLQSARRAQPRFELTADNVADVTRICRLVGGMPLGIVLGASWLAVLSPEEVAAEIEHGLDILEAAGGEVEARHQSMRAVFDQSWRLMTEGEQQLFAQLSVFRGGFTREAVQAITGVDLRTLLGLVNKALIRRRASTGRFEMHELLRQYAAEKLEGMGIPAGVRDAHAAYFAQFVAERDLDEGKFSQKEIADSIDADFENIRAAWLWSLEQRHHHLLLKMTVPIWAFVWLRQYRFDEVVLLYEKALSVLDGQEDTGAAQKLRGRLLVCFAPMIHRHHRQWGRAERLARQGLEITRAAEDELGWALAQNLFVFVSSRHGNNLPEALTMLDKSLQTFLKLDRISLAADSQLLKALALGQVGARLRELRAALQESISMYRQAGNRWMVSVALGDFGETLRQQADYPQAMAHFQESVTLARQEGLLPIHGSNVAHLYAITGDYERARRWYKKTVAIYQTTGNRHLTMYGMIDLAIVATLEGNDEEAEELLDECRRVYPTLSRDSAYEHARGFLAYRRGNYEQAIERFERLLENETYDGWIATASPMQGLAQVKMGQLEAGRQSLLLGLQKAYKIGHRIDYPRAVYGLAEVASALDRKEEAVQLAALVHNDAATPHEVKAYAADLLKPLEADLPTELYEAAHTQGNSLDLDTVVEQLLDEDSDTWSALRS